METDGDDIGGTYGQMMRDRNGQSAKDSIVAVLYDTDVALNVDCIRHPTSCSNSWSKTEWEKKKAGGYGICRCILIGGCREET